MLGAIAGDIIGSVFEFDNIKTTDFQLFTNNSNFTDDTVLTIAVADCLLNGKNYVSAYKEYGKKYPRAGYGESFELWIFSQLTEPYNSWGNGSAMRVSPVGFALENLEEVLEEAEKSAQVTHNHPEGIKGAQATASAIFLARKNKNKREIKEYVESQFGYNLSRSLDEIRPNYRFDVSCQGSVPEAIIAFLESENFEDAIRKAILIGGDSDTIACIAGGIAQAFYKEVPLSIVKEVKKRLTPELLLVVEKFEKRFMKSRI